MKEVLLSSSAISSLARVTFKGTGLLSIASVIFCFSIACFFVRPNHSASSAYHKLINELLRRDVTLCLQICINVRLK